MDSFEMFWSAWPNNVRGGYERKGGKSDCRKRWVKGKLDDQVEVIIRHVEWLKTSEAWQKERGRFIPMPATYLNQQRWDGADIPSVIYDPRMDVRRASTTADAARLLGISEVIDG